MKWIQFLLILSLLPGLPLFQMDQAIDIDRSVNENSLVIKSEMNDPSADQNLWFDLTLRSSSFNQVQGSLSIEETLYLFYFPTFRGPLLSGGPHLTILLLFP